MSMHTELLPDNVEETRKPERWKQAMFVPGAVIFTCVVCGHTERATGTVVNHCLEWPSAEAAAKDFRDKEAAGEFRNTALGKGTAWYIGPTRVD
ncbi:hypothetical protein EB061_03685 [bacterium]|nr:hypothetical protein [bacterium]